MISRAARSGARHVLLGAAVSAALLLPCSALWAQPRASLEPLATFAPGIGRCVAPNAADSAMIPAGARSVVHFALPYVAPFGGRDVRVVADSMGTPVRYVELTMIMTAPDDLTIHTIAAALGPRGEYVGVHTRQDRNTPAPASAPQGIPADTARWLADAKKRFESIALDQREREAVRVLAAWVWRECGEKISRR